LGFKPPRTYYQSIERRTSMDTTFRDNASSAFRGARIAITGGTSGLGLSLVRECVTRGAAVAFIARARDRVERVAEEIRSRGNIQGIHGIVGDIARKNDIHPLALQILGTLGGLDVLVNNASSLGPTPLALLADTECEDFEGALAANVLGPFRLTKALLGALAVSARERRGSIVLNISSDAAINPYAGWGAYGASKAALHQMSRIWNEELGEDGIRFLSVDPGDMDTPLHALALPDADRAALKRPEIAARELADKIALALASLRAPRASDQAESASVA
jgi:NAD(P)-dependent dehydrogenase (short-subunit alcohol dehydrogenase family)